VRITSLPSFMLCAIGVVGWGCSASTEGVPMAETSGGDSAASGDAPSSGGTNASGGTVGGGGAVGFGGSVGSGGTTTSSMGGTPASGDNMSTGGSVGSGGTTGTGGTTATGGTISTGGTMATGGSTTATGGTISTGGTMATGGRTFGFGGTTSTGGTVGTGGTTGTGGSTGTSGSSEVDCSATMPTGGTDHCGSNTQGNAGGLSWSLWSNALNSGSCITTYDTTAFSARWSESGDFLARVGVEWGNSGKTYEEYGTIAAEFSYNKTGSGGGFSYIGIYGWSNNPCVEYYIVEDSFNNFPFDAWNATQTGTASIDGEDYKLFRNTTNGTGGSRCSGVSTWDQFWSIRQSARQCGVVSISQHFDAWKAAGMNMGSLLEAKILVEVGGGTGSIEFPVANVTAN
jgi:endo-1,4-beta-xylanase